MSTSQPQVASAVRRGRSENATSTPVESGSSNRVAFALARTSSMTNTVAGARSPIKSEALAVVSENTFSKTQSADSRQVVADRGHSRHGTGNSNTSWSDTYQVSRLDIAKAVQDDNPTVFAERQSVAEQQKAEQSVATLPPLQRSPVSAQSGGRTFAPFNAPVARRDKDEKPDAMGTPPHTPISSGRFAIKPTTPSILIARVRNEAHRRIRGGGQSIFAERVEPRTSVHSAGSPQKEEVVRFHTDGSIAPEVRLRPSCYVVAGLVEHPCFDPAMGALIFLNAILMGVQTEFSAQAARSGAEEPPIISYAGSVFCLAFTAELILRFLAQGPWDFLFSASRYWNLFDVILVGMQVFEELVSVMVSSKDGEVNTSYSFLRVLRVLRLVRVARLVRVLRLIKELRTMIQSIFSTLSSLVWTVVLLLLLIYIAAICFTQLVADYGMKDPELVVEGTLFHTYYGTVWLTVMSLYQAITGGISWRELCDVLMETGNGGLVGIIFSMYVAFTCLTVFNVITGVFVDSALNMKKKEDLRDMEESLWEVVDSMDLDKPDRIKRSEFNQRVSDPKLQAYFKDLDLHVEEATCLFDLLDFDKKDEIETVEFVNGCKRLRGTAKSLDMMTLMTQVRRITDFLDYQYQDPDVGRLTPTTTKKSWTPRTPVS